MAAESRESTEVAIIHDKRHGRRYVKGRFLGKGGFARCHELTDMDTKEVFAGKIVAKSALAKQHMKSKMAMEIQIHRSLCHKYVVQFMSYFEDSENVYIVLEICRRRSLMELHKRRRLLTEPEVRFFMHQIASSVLYLHENKVIHRDLKLSNLFLSDQLDIKLGDFGLATKIDYDGERKKTLCGTPNYIAPEVLAKKGHSYEVDIWSVGCIMYTLLVGRPPFEASSLKETYIRIRKNDYSIPHKVSDSAQRLIVRMLHPEPSCRPTAAQILKDEFFVAGLHPARLPVSSLTMAPRFDKANATASVATSRPVLTERNQPVAPICTAVSKKPIASEVAVPTTAAEKIAVESDPVDINSEPSPEACLQELEAQLMQLLGSDPPSKPAASYDDAEDPAACPVFWIGKWVDYSDKYGFGYTLCDSSAGVLFNDSTRMLLAANDRSVQYVDRIGNEMFMTTEMFPDALSKKMMLLKYFRNYMNMHLLRAGGRAPEAYENARLPMLHTWFRTRSAIVLQLTNGILQINFFSDHTKLILCPRMQAVTFIDQDKSFRTFRFSLIENFGCSEGLAKRLGYAKTTVERMLSGTAVHVKTAS